MRLKVLFVALFAIPGLIFGIGFSPKKFTKWGFEFFGVMDIMKDLFQCFMPQCNMVYTYDLTYQHYNPSQDQNYDIVVVAGGLGDPQQETGYGILVVSLDGGFTWYPLPKNYTNPQNITFFSRKLWTVAGGLINVKIGNNLTQAPVFVASGDEGIVVIAAFYNGKWYVKELSSTFCGDDILAIEHIGSGVFIGVGDDGRICKFTITQVVLPQSNSGSIVENIREVKYRGKYVFRLKRKSDNSSIHTFLYGIAANNNYIVIVGDLGKVYYVDMRDLIGHWNSNFSTYFKAREINRYYKFDPSLNDTVEIPKSMAPIDPIYDVIWDRGNVFIAVGQNGLFYEIYPRGSAVVKVPIFLKPEENGSLAGSRDGSWQVIPPLTFKGIAINKALGPEIYMIVSREGTILLSNAHYRREGWISISPDPAYRIQLNKAVATRIGFSSGALGMNFTIVPTPRLTFYPEDIYIPISADGGTFYVTVRFKNNTLLPVTIKGFNVDRISAAGNNNNLSELNSIECAYSSNNNSSASTTIAPGDICEHIFVYTQEPYNSDNYSVHINEDFYLITYWLQDYMDQNRSIPATVTVQVAQKVDTKEGTTVTVGGCTSFNGVPALWLIVGILIAVRRLIRRAYSSL